MQNAARLNAKCKMQNAKLQTAYDGQVRSALLAIGLPALVVAVCGGAYALTLAPGVTWANGGLDSGELIAAAETGGVPHPTGYPTYMLLARLVLLLPISDPALAVTLLSPLAATLTALVVGDMVRRWSAAEEPWASAAGMSAALGLALAPLFWSQAVIAEVYSLGALFAALLLHAALRSALEPERVAPSLTTSILAGAALGAQVTLLPFVLTWVAIASRARGRRAWGGKLARIGGGVALGLLVYLYLPLAARANPPINWGDASSWQGFWWLVSGRLYAGMAFGLPPEQLGGRLLAWGALLLQQFGWLGVLVGGLGFVRGGRPVGALRWLTLGLALTAVLFALGYNSVDAQVHLIPAVVIGALWVGLGVEVILGFVAVRQPKFTPLVALALVVGLLWPAPFTAQQVDASGDRRAISYAAAILEQAPADAIVLTDDDRSSFPLWHYHFGRGQRPDLRLVTGPLLGFAWYRASLRATYPDLRLPELAPRGWEAALAEAPGRSGPLCHAVAAPVALVSCGEEPEPEPFGARKPRKAANHREMATHVQSYGRR